jgi:hypothetical protein
MYCDYFSWPVSCTVVVLNCCVICGCSNNCVGVLVIRVLVIFMFCIVCTVFLHCFTYVYFIPIFFILSVLM